MASEYEVKSFLRDFKYKLNFKNGALYRDDRGKNLETLLLLELASDDRKVELLALEVSDYCEGPVKDILYKGPGIWVFGRTIKGHEIYIKITIGQYGGKVVCISFHLAESTLNYPFK